CCRASRNRCGALKRSEYSLRDLRRSDSAVKPAPLALHQVQPSVLEGDSADDPVVRGLSFGQEEHVWLTSGRNDVEPRLDPLHDGALLGSEREEHWANLQLSGLYWHQSG